MADENEKMKNPWAAITAAVAFAALAGFHYFTLNAIEAQSEQTQQIINAANANSHMETTGLRTRQQLILSEIREMRVEAGASHGAEQEMAPEGEEAGEEPAGDEASE